ncbi:MAG: hypothetical protein IE931_12330 [Sphingobacteriales bacterium]|nr:hypothetical protein [Sphingobacteriales bacterium]
MLRKSIPTFRFGILVTALGIALYFNNETYGKYLLGFGLVSISIAMVFYVFFMLKRYGEHKNTH